MPEFIKLVRKVFTSYQLEVKALNTRIRQLEDELIIAKAKLNTSNRLLESSESKRQQLITQLDTNCYK